MCVVFLIIYISTNMIFATDALLLFYDLMGHVQNILIKNISSTVVFMWMHSMPYVMIDWTMAELYQTNICENMNSLSQLNTNKKSAKSPHQRHCHVHQIPKSLLPMYTWHTWLAWWCLAWWKGYPHSYSMLYSMLYAAKCYLSIQCTFIEITNFHRNAHNK